MVTAEEVGAVTVFASLEVDARDRLSRVSADIALAPGEYAANQGDDRALFAVLEGRIEPVKLVDGIESVVGERHPGDIFGEVPIVLGTVFPVGFRAAEQSRVMRIEPHDYHAVAAIHPDVAKEIGKLSRKRIGGSGGLQSLASEPPPPRAVVLGHRWDSDCGEVRRFLDRNQISFEWIDPDAPDAGERWGAPIPAAENVLVEVLAAAVYGASEGLRTIAIEREAPGGQAGTSSRIENYLGFPSGVSGDELAGRALKQARRLGAEILVTRTIERIDARARQMHLDGGDILRARTIILACGVSWRRLTIEGFDRLAGKGISYGAARSEAPNTHGLDVQIIGAGNSAGQAAIFFSNHAKSVTILCRGDVFEKSMSRYLIDQLAARSNIAVLPRTEVVAAHGDSSLEAIEVRNNQTGEFSRLGSGGLFAFIGADAETAWLPREIALDERGYVLTGSDVATAGRWELDRDPYLLETSVPGVFACGDVRSGPVKRVASAVGEGSMAIALVHQFMKESGVAVGG